MNFSKISSNCSYLRASIVDEFMTFDTSCGYNKKYFLAIKIKFRENFFPSQKIFHNQSSAQSNPNPDIQPCIRLLPFRPHVSKATASMPTQNISNSFSSDSRFSSPFVLIKTERWPKHRVACHTRSFSPFSLCFSFLLFAACDRSLSIVLLYFGVHARLFSLSCRLSLVVSSRVRLAP